MQQDLRQVLDEIPAMERQSIVHYVAESLSGMIQEVSLNQDEVGKVYDALLYTRIQAYLKR